MTKIEQEIIDMYLEKIKNAKDDVVRREASYEYRNFIEATCKRQEIKEHSSGN